MRARTKQQVVAEFRCGEILDAARRVFSRKGFANVTVDEIAEAAGLTKATVYQYFPSKQEIYMTALRAGVGELAERTERCMAQATGGIQNKVETFIRTRLEFLYENREFFAVYHAEFGNLIHPASLNGEFRALYRRQLGALEAELRAAVANGGLVDICPATLATTIYESTRGLMLRRSLGWTTVTVDEQVTMLMKILWHGLEKRSAPRKSQEVAEHVDR
jgi:AcrR family transcriptional regulator